MIMKLHEDKEYFKSVVDYIFEDFVHKVIPDSNWEAYNIGNGEHDDR